MNTEIKSAEEIMEKYLPFFTNLMGGEKKAIKRLIEEVRRESEQFTPAIVGDGVKEIEDIYKDCWQDGDEVDYDAEGHAHYYSDKNYERTFDYEEFGKQMEEYYLKILQSQQPIKSVQVVCAICGKPITETGTSYNDKPVHIGCYHKAKQVEPIKSVPNGWISVEDRLPEKIFKSFYDKELNAWLTPTSIQVLGFDGELVYECSFTDEGEFLEFGSKSENITHWQPLPAPPNRKGQPINNKKKINYE